MFEFPIGKPLYRTSGWLDGPAIAPDGRQVAFLDHPVKADDRVYVVLVDGADKARRLTQEWSSLKGLAWSKKTGGGGEFAKQTSVGIHAFLNHSGIRGQLIFSS